MRCLKEASLHEQNCFITLTYSPENCPSDMSLSVSEWQKFMKRLRKTTGQKIRFYHCGEYGSQFGRPHYHALLFGYDFPDKRWFRTTRRGDRLYRSALLESVWTHGYSTIGAVTFNSAAYVARYVMKKITGDVAEDHYTWVDEDGVIHSRRPEYCTMSRRPGIARDWFEQYKDDVYNGDFILVDGKKLRPPKYFDGLYEASFPSDYRALKMARKRRAKEHADNNTPLRRRVREKLQLARLEQLKRSIDE